MSGPVFRDGTPADAPALTALARRAKAAWGYPDAWLREWEDALRFTAEDFARSRVRVAERNGSVVGVVALTLDPLTGTGEIEHLWVDPAAHRMGIGRALVEWAVEQARALGVGALRIESDPNARAFYERLGAAAVGSVPAPVCGEARTLPVLRLAT